MKVKEIMTDRVVTVTTDTPVPDIAGLLRDNRISGVPVVDPEGAVIGLVSEYD
ncbi:MAG: CBS domain-containing protein, partial [Trebonia sp.]